MESLLVLDYAVGMADKMCGMVGVFLYFQYPLMVEEDEAVAIEIEIVAE